jgi:hypothetical protein
MCQWPGIERMAWPCNIMKWIYSHGSGLRSFQNEQPDPPCELLVFPYLPLWMLKFHDWDEFWSIYYNYTRLFWTKVQWKRMDTSWSALKRVITCWTSFARVSTMFPLSDPTRRELDMIRAEWGSNTYTRGNVFITCLHSLRFHPWKRVDTCVHPWHRNQCFRAKSRCLCRKNLCWPIRSETVWQPDMTWYCWRGGNIRRGEVRFYHILFPPSL